MEHLGHLGGWGGRRPRCPDRPCPRVIHGNAGMTQHESLGVKASNPRSGQGAPRCLNPTESLYLKELEHNQGCPLPRAKPGNYVVNRGHKAHDLGASVQQPNLSNGSIPRSSQPCTGKKYWAYLPEGHPLLPGPAECPPRPEVPTAPRGPVGVCSSDHPHTPTNSASRRGSACGFSNSSATGRTLRFGSWI